MNRTLLVIAPFLLPVRDVGSRIIGAMGVAVAMLLPSMAAGASAGQLAIAPATAGSCSVEVTLPSEARIDKLLVNGKAVSQKVIEPIGDDKAIVLLTRPLRQHERLTVRLRSGEQKEADNRVGPGVSGDITCGSPRNPPDDRNVFDLVGFYGLVFDNFAPAMSGGYSASDTSRTRHTFGLTGKYRLYGEPGSNRQLWLLGNMLNGLRTGDINCLDPNATGDTVLCQNGAPSDTIGVPTPNMVTQVLKRASSLEAYGEVRYELVTLQPRSTTPAKVFAFYQYRIISIIQDCPSGTASGGGVINIVDSSCVWTNNKDPKDIRPVFLRPQVFPSQYFGVGGMIPAGSFRDSTVWFGLGDEFEKSMFSRDLRNVGRVKFHFNAIFDVLPQLKQSDIGKWFGFGSWRFFFVFDVDRDRWSGNRATSGSAGSNNIQTYIGLAFDLGKVFHP